MILVDEMNLYEARKQAGLTQKEVAEMFNLSLRTIQRYESNDKYETSLSYKHILNGLCAMFEITEEKGILKVSTIIELSSQIFHKYAIDVAVLFGSYAKGTMMPNSDIDIVMAGDVSGMKLFGLIEELRNALKKKVDLVTVDSILTNKILITQVLKEGIKIYG